MKNLVLATALLLGNAGAQSWQLCEQAANPSNLKGVDSLVQGKDGVIFRPISDFREDFTLSETTLKNLKNLNSALSDQGIKMVLLYIPTRGIMLQESIDKDQPLESKYNASLAADSFRATLKSLNAIDIAAPDLLSIGIRDDFFGPRDHHWTPEGALLAAQVVASAIKKLPAYDSLPKSKFKTTVSSTLKFTGSFADAAEQICNRPPAKVRLDE